MSAALAWPELFADWNPPLATEGKSREPRSVRKPNFEVIHARIAKTIARIVNRRLSAHEDREDVVQDVLLQVFVQMDKLRDPECLEMWAARIALNMVNAHIRRCSRRRARHDTDSQGDGRHEEDWEGRLVATRALSAIGKMPTRERELFCRWCFATTSWPKLASDAKCSEPTIKRRVLRVRTRFERLALRDPNLVGLVRT